MPVESQKTTRREGRAFYSSSFLRIVGRVNVENVAENGGSIRDGSTGVTAASEAMVSASTA